MIKNSNINEESIKAMKEFRQKQIQSNIRLHIIFLILIIFLNLGLIIFILIYKSKINQIKSKTDKNSSSINTDKDSITQYNNEIQHKVVNLIAISYEGFYHFSFFFETSKEVDTVKNYIVQFYKDNYNKYNNDNFNKDKFMMYFRYQGMMDGDNFASLRKKIDNGYQTFFFIETDKKEKFGFYIEDPIIFGKKGRYADNEEDNKCFIFSFRKEGIFKCIGKKQKLEIKKDDDEMIVIGNGDIIIKNNYLGESKTGIINYPFKSFDVSTINSNIFTGENKEFNIRGLEIFCFDFNYYIN